MKPVEPNRSAARVLWGWLLLCGLVAIFWYAVVYRGVGA